MSRKHQRGCRPQRYTVEQVAEALRLSAGILSAAGEKLGFSGQCVANYLSRYPKLAEVAREAQEATLDLAKSGLVSLIKERHPTSILFYLRTKGKHRGYNTTMQVTTADQKFFPSDAELTMLTDQELDVVEAYILILKRLANLTGRQS